MKTVPSVFTLSMLTIYLSHKTHIAVGTVFRKQTVAQRNLQVGFRKHLVQPSLLYERTCGSNLALRSQIINMKHLIAMTSCAPFNFKIQG